MNVTLFHSTGLSGSKIIMQDEEEPEKKRKKAAEPVKDRRQGIRTFEAAV